MRLKDKVIIVTGGATGIGRAIAERCVQEGASVLVHGLETADAEAVAKSLGEKAVPHADDLVDPASPARVAASALCAFGRIDAVVNNAAAIVRSNLSTTTAEFFDRVMAINVRAPMLLIQAAFPELKRNRGVRGLPSVVETATNYPEAWKGGLWRPTDIAEIEMTASRALLSLASKYRARYLRNFYELGKANLKPDSDVPQAYVIPAGQPNAENVARLIEILTWQGMEVYRMTEELWMKHQRSEFPHEMPLNSFLVFTNQPQKNNVLSLFERQEYPHRLLPNGEAEVPYDVAGWTLPLQMGVETHEVWEIRDLERNRGTLKRVSAINDARAVLNLARSAAPFDKIADPLKTNPRIGLYKPFTSSMDEGWTRLVFDQFQIPFRSVSNDDFRNGRLDLDVIVLAADNENTILRGLSADRYPAELAGGIGDAGVANLKKFVENGGKLVCFDDSCALAIKQFNLPVRNVVAGVRRSEFYNPGSIVKLKVDTQDPLGRGMFEETPAYFSTSSAFDVGQDGGLSFRVAARYAEKDALMSGWMLGEKHINGKAALVEVQYGKGKIVLFAFRPQHRGQTWGTFRFIFNALEKY